ncbi:hypothetical protein [Alloalcanivorax xenomutans]|jgi:hypothetical protein|uniref:hypothetical protein n=1 Tax=Alloalcanivorax xenomutans TaxID=1094342 RepID=UPI000E287575|eukprot:gnl/TRDRNA2_/TRDRNA2_177063_c0_seq3.p1 gnl/TRDRNA2_/TRDRNA2_177063_c0~~gnl/TRDRNA2_/TRDRNA2_177063_c0_seq3.p1  ORF type:complete len:291 (-),score=9.36 gnl/TRDRNA2_/TRDRNA2_177063_c0_seq3:314-1186(-)
MKKVVAFFSFDDRAVHKQWAFLVWVGISFVPFIVGFLGIFLGREMDFTNGGFYNFFDLMQPLMWWLGLPLLVAAFIARLHASHHVEKRMKMDSEMHTFNGYIAHRKYIADSIKSFSSSIIVPGEVDTEGLYRKLFPGNNPKRFHPVSEPNDEGLALIEVQEEALVFSLKMGVRMHKDNSEEWAFAPDPICTTVVTGITSFGLKPTLVLVDLFSNSIADGHQWNDDSFKILTNAVGEYANIIGYIRYLGGWDKNAHIKGIIPLMWGLRSHGRQVRRKWWEDRAPELISLDG